MHETMRLKPVAPFNIVQALHDTTVGDIAVPAGTLVWCVIRHDSLQERWFEAAQEFRPQRWLAEGSPGAAAASAKRVAMPFGAGPRICPGRYLAMLEMKLVMATLLGGFDIESVETPGGAEAEEALAFTMAPAGLCMRLRPRTG